MHAESEPFLEDTSHDPEDNLHGERPFEKSVANCRRWHVGGYQFALLQVFLIALYAVMAMVIIISYHRKSGFIGKAISGLDVVYDGGTHNLYAGSEFAGPPSEAVDNAWSKLLEDIDIRVTAQELRQHNRTSVSLPNGGHLAWLGVYHELHCVKLLRQWKYKDHYFPNLTVKEAHNPESHTDHCLDRMRAAFMCHPDVRSLVTFDWDSSPKPQVNGMKTLHSCVDWDALVASMSNRTVSLEELESAVNPLLHANTTSPERRGAT